MNLAARPIRIALQEIHRRVIRPRLQMLSISRKPRRFERSRQRLDVEQRRLIGMIAVNERDCRPDGARMQPVVKVHGCHRIEFQVPARILRPGIEDGEDAFGVERARGVKNARPVSLESAWQIASDVPPS